MKVLPLSPAQRLGLLNVLNEQHGKASQMATIFRVIELIRIPEEEAKAINLKIEQTENRVSLTWDPAQPSKVIDIEDKDGEVVLQVLQAWERFEPMDTPWLAPILDALAKGL